MQNNPSLEFEKHTPPSEIAYASKAALAVLTEAVHNADTGLIPRFARFSPPQQHYEEPTPEQDSYADYADFEAYRQRNQAAQPQQVSVTPEQTPNDLLHQDDDLDRIRQQIDAVHAEMTADKAQTAHPTITPINDRPYLDDRNRYDQGTRHAA